MQILNQTGQCKPSYLASYSCMDGVVDNIDEVLVHTSTDEVVEEPANAGTDDITWGKGYISSHESTIMYFSSSDLSSIQEETIQDGADNTEQLYRQMRETLGTTYEKYETRNKNEIEERDEIENTHKEDEPRQEYEVEVREAQKEVFTEIKQPYVHKNIHKTPDDHTIDASDVKAEDEFLAHKMVHEPPEDNFQHSDRDGPDDVSYDEGTDENQENSVSHQVQRFNIEQMNIHPQTVKAGERLYNQALERYKRLAAIADSNPLPQPKKKSQAKKKCTGNAETPRYLKLYEDGMKKHYSKPPRATSSDRSLSQKSRLSDSSVKPLGENDSFLRLYNLSKSKQDEGKKRRMKIKKASKKETDAVQDKISVKDAERLYLKGVKHLLHLDNRRIESAELHQIQHQPYRFREELKERVEQL
jgi:hypothetical protein